MPLATRRPDDYPMADNLPNMQGSVAQGIERPPPKRQVDGSNPSGVTISFGSTLLRKTCFWLLRFRECCLKQCAEIDFG